VGVNVAPHVAPYRQYIWQVGTYDTDLTDADGSPDSRAGQSWCFGYWESEWINPEFQVEDDEVNLTDAKFGDYKNRVTKDINLRISCNE
tara:strand:- start:661 stop:927 length:267 start_codon:yes stop_codon:yes gene_type:complete